MKYIISTLLIFSIAHSEPITPLPNNINLNNDKISLGKKLFFDTLLSLDNTISCASCHDLENGGDDGLKVSFGINGQKGTINSPTVYNAVYNFRQFWNGRAKDLAQQAMGPIENPVEMGNTFENLINTLNTSPYKKEFKKIVDKDGFDGLIKKIENKLLKKKTPAKKGKKK